MGRVLGARHIAVTGLLCVLVCHTAAIKGSFRENDSSISDVNYTGENVNETKEQSTRPNRLSRNISVDSDTIIYPKSKKLKREITEIHCTRVNSSTVGGPGASVAERMNLSGHIYGGSQQRRQYWPLDNVTYNKLPYVVSHIDNQGIAERYWLTSKAEFHYVEPPSPLFLELNNRRGYNFVFFMETIPPYPTSRPLIHTYHKCTAANVRYAHAYALLKHFKTPTGLPDRNMTLFPIWSTSVRYRKNISQDIILQFANEIINNGFSGSQIQIDDSWETCYGSLTFDEEKFPDPRTLSATLKKMGFRVTLWVHPFINTDCDPYYTEALESDYFVKNEHNETNTTWWNGEAAVIDFTNEEAVQWWSWRIQEMMDTYGIDSLKFDAGETSWLPKPPVLSGDKLLQPNIYTQKYAQTAATFGNMVEARVGFQTQDLPVFVRMQDKDSRWDFENGLRTLVTTLFQMNMAGYSFVLPDKVGGNGVDGPPSKELFIRWLQATVFMPAIQFSYVPWDYDNETVAIAKKYTYLHERVSHMVVRAMKKTMKNGFPVNFPIWWISPKDTEAQVINDEFLLGDDILIAPVLEEGALSRHIYLPEGFWIDMLHKEFDKVIVGPVWLMNYTAKIEDLPYFVENTSLKLLCEGGDHDGNWCTDGAVSFSGGIFMVFTLGASVVLNSLL